MYTVKMIFSSQQALKVHRHYIFLKTNFIMAYWEFSVILLIITRNIDSDIDIRWHLIWQRITDEGTLPDTSVWSFLLVPPDFKLVYTS